MFTACILRLRFAISSSLNLRKHEIDASSVCAVCNLNLFNSCVGHLDPTAQSLPAVHFGPIHRSKFVAALSMQCVCFVAQVRLEGLIAIFGAKPKPKPEHSDSFEAS